jgi:hypothetical protein
MMIAQPGTRESEVGEIETTVFSDVLQKRIKKNQE